MRSFNGLVTWRNSSCLRASMIVTRVAWKCWLVMIIFYSLYKPGWFKCFCKLCIVWFMSFVSFAMWEIISQAPIKPCTFRIVFEVIFKDWLLLLWCCAHPLKPFILEQRNRLVWGLHVWFSENFFRNSRTKCMHIQQPLNHKTIKRLRPLIFLWIHSSRNRRMQD